MQQYVANLVEVCREVRRVLRPDGLFFLNLGDSYAANRSYQVPESKWRDVGNNMGRRLSDGFKEKDLLLVPSRVAIALVDDGWYLRNDCVWTKPNVKPESITDRFVVDYEHVFMLTRSPKYYFDWIAVSEPHKTSAADRKRHKKLGTRNQAHAQAVGQVTNAMRDSHGGLGFGAAGRRRRTTWSFTTRSYKGAHFATWPEPLAELMLRAGASGGGCCAACGAPRVRVTVKGEPDRDLQVACGSDAEGRYEGTATKDFAAAGAEDASAVKARILEGLRPRLTLGWRFACRCHGAVRERFPRTADARKRRRQDLTGDWRLRVAVRLAASPGSVAPCRVLDPFCGSGTTLAVAHRLGLDAAGTELQDKYVALCQERVEKAGGTLEVLYPPMLLAPLVEEAPAAILPPRWLCDFPCGPGEPEELVLQKLVGLVRATRLAPVPPEVSREGLEVVEEETSGWVEDTQFTGFSWEEAHERRASVGGWHPSCRELTDVPGG